MTSKLRVLAFVALTMVVASCGGGADSPVSEQAADESPAASDSSQDEELETTSDEDPATTSADVVQQSVRAAIEGSFTRTVNGVEQTVVQEVGDVVYGADGRYQRVQAFGYDGPPVWVNNAVGEGILHKQISPVSIPLVPAVRADWEASFANLTGDGFTLLGGDTYVLADPDGDLGLDDSQRLSFAQAVEQYGELEQQWSGPLTPEVICHYSPNEHLMAVVSGEIAGDILRWQPQVARNGCSLLLPRSDAMGAVAINAFDVADADHFGQQADGFPDVYFEDFFADRSAVGQQIEGLGTAARLWSTDELQQLQVQDGTSAFLLSGPGAEYLEDDALVDVARVLVARFSASTRMDAPPELLTGDALNDVQLRMTEHAELRTAIANGEQKQGEIFAHYEHTDDAHRAVVQTGVIFTSEVLRAFERSDTSMGDIIEVVHCGIETSDIDAERPSVSDSVEIVRWSVDTGRIVDSRRRYAFDGSWCAPVEDMSDFIEPDFTEADLRAAMSIDNTDPDSIAADIPRTQECVVERSFAELGFEQLVEWGVTPDDPQINGLFRAFSDDEALMLAQITADCGVAAAAVWLGATGAVPPDWDALMCFNDRVGTDVIIDLVVSQIQGDVEPRRLSP